MGENFASHGNEFVALLARREVEYQRDCEIRQPKHDEEERVNGDHSQPIEALRKKNTTIQWNHDAPDFAWNTAFKDCSSLGKSTSKLWETLGNSDSGIL